MAYIRANAQHQPSLEEVAAHACLSPFHFQKIFTEWAGVSPKKFLQYLTLQHAKTALSRTVNLSEAAEACGLSGSSRLHDLFLTIEGITPGEFRQQGEQLRIHYSTGTSPFGAYLVASTPQGICYLHFYQQEEEAVRDLQQAWPRAELKAEQVELHQQVALFLHNTFPQQPQKIRLHLKGTPFQLKVWEALLRIPEGYLTSYSTLAHEIGQPTASRAVGTAIGSNPVAFLIPCHRVIKSIGGIGEYRWGSERKMAIIGWEAAKSGTDTTQLAASEQLPLF